MEITQKTIIDNITDRSINNLNVTAFESLGGATIDYRTFFSLVDIYAKAFLELGIENGDCVTVCTAGTLDTILYFSGLNRIGAVTQLVNPKFFKHNGKKYIDDTNSKLLICMDRFYPLIKDEIERTGIKKILLASISEYASSLVKIIAKRQKIKDADKINGVEYLSFPDFVKLGENSNIRLDRIHYEKDKPAVITYTSGTTGEPKGIVHTNDSINNMISIYAKINIFSYSRKCRNLVLIPPMYMTSFVHSIFAPMYWGHTFILQPIYNPDSFAKDLKKYEPDIVIASKSHYTGLAKSGFPKGAFNFVSWPYCGGEAISKNLAIRINEILNYYGMPPIIIGYGQTEFGTMTMVNQIIPTRTNESGILLPEIKTKILDPVTGEPVKRGERGELYISSPAMMKEYLNNEEATSRFISYDENGERWGKTGDIGRVAYQFDGQDVYEVSGRKTDSLVDKDGKIVYLFDIEEEVETSEYVKEAEVVSMEVNGTEVPVVHIILNENVKEKTDIILKNIRDIIRNKFENPSYIPYAYKIRKSFSTSPISGKRDYNILKTEKDGYLQIVDDKLKKITIE